MTQKYSKWVKIHSLNFHFNCFTNAEMIESLFPGGNCSITRVKDENFMSLLWRWRRKWEESVNNDKFCAAGRAEMKIELWSFTMAWKLVIEKLLYEEGFLVIWKLSIGGFIYSIIEIWFAMISRKKCAHKMLNLHFTSSCFNYFPLLSSCLHTCEYARIIYYPLNAHAMLNDSCFKNFNSLFLPLFATLLCKFA